jgi:hypothetical protein
MACYQLGHAWLTQLYGWFLAHSKAWARVAVVSVIINRAHQEGLAQLLTVQSQKVGFISRSHWRVCMSSHMKWESQVYADGQHAPRDARCQAISGCQSSSRNHGLPANHAYWHHMTTLTAPEPHASQRMAAAHHPSHIQRCGSSMGHMSCTGSFTALPQAARRGHRRSRRCGRFGSS